MVAKVKNEGKTAFVKEVLAKDDKANSQAVNDAWTAAGHEGTISTTLVQVIRAKLGLTGNTRAGRKPSDGRTTPGTERKNTRTSSSNRSPKSPRNGRSIVSAHDSGTTSNSSGRIRVLTRLEGQIDELIFEVKGVGGLREFEETLRKARRILVRSYED